MVWLLPAVHTLLEHLLAGVLTHVLPFPGADGGETPST